MYSLWEVIAGFDRMKRDGQIVSWKLHSIDFDTGMADISFQPVKPVEYIHLNVVIPR